MKFFKLPDLGEGLAEAEIVEWKVKVGDTVAVDQVLLSVETAKALVDVPSPVAGVIARLCGEEGDILHIGAPLVEFEGGEDDGTVVGKVSAHQHHIEDHFVVGAIAPGGTLVRAMPAVRLLAQKLGLDIERLKGSGNAGMVTEQDVQAAFEAMQGSGNEFLKGSRRAMAKAMEISHQTVVPVSITDEVDLRHWRADEDVTVRLIKAIGVACRAEPSMNAWFDGETLSRRLFNEVNVAIAVDSRHGLYVPVMEKRSRAGRGRHPPRAGSDDSRREGPCCAARDAAGGDHHANQLWRHRGSLRQPHSDAAPGGHHRGREIVRKSGLHSRGGQTGSGTAFVDDV